MKFLVVACALLGVALGQVATGYKGYKPGYNGFPAGYQGYGGYNGNKGYNGYQGYNGYPGQQGYNGYNNGYQGYTGYQGHNGYQGYRGQIPVPVIVKPPEATQDKEPTKTETPAVVPAPAVLSAFTAIAPVVSNGPYPAIRSQTQENYPDGAYEFSYETENGIAAAERRASPSAGPNGPVEVVVGEYSYTAPDGTPVHVRYTAGPDGFHPEIISAGHNGGYFGGAARSAGSVETVKPVAVDTSAGPAAAVKSAGVASAEPAAAVESAVVSSPEPVEAVKSAVVASAESEAPAAAATEA